MLPPDPNQTLPIVLSAPQARVLGALVEKEVTTPEYYPLSLNALINACNQRSNREPVMALDEEEVRQARRPPANCADGPSECTASTNSPTCWPDCKS